MPTSKDPTSRGDFIIQVAITFPLTLSTDQKLQLCRTHPVESVVERMKDGVVIEERIVIIEEWIIV
jgi:hypothetical protein